MTIRTKESLSGFVASDPELTFTSKGDARLYARIGQPAAGQLGEIRRWLQLEPTFTDLVMFRKSAELAHEQFRKGDDFLAGRRVPACTPAATGPPTRSVRHLPDRTRQQHHPLHRRPRPARAEAPQQETPVREQMQQALVERKRSSTRSHRPRPRVPAPCSATRSPDESQVQRRRCPPPSGRRTRLPSLRRDFRGSPASPRLVPGASDAYRQYTAPRPTCLIPMTPMLPDAVTQGPDFDGIDLSELPAGRLRPSAVGSRWWLEAGRVVWGCRYSGRGSKESRESRSEVKEAGDPDLPDAGSDRAGA